MNDEQFTKLFKYMQREFSTIRKEMQGMHKRLDSVYDLVDKDLKRKETDEQERLAINHQLERHVSWFKQLAKNTKTDLVPGP